MPAISIVPYDYQRWAERKLHRFGLRALLALEQGLGKTPVTLFAALRRLDDPMIVVVCPSSARYTWEREALTNFGLRCHVHSGYTPPPDVKIARRRLHVINYESLRGARAEGKAWVFPWQQYFHDLNPGLIVLDESQALCDENSLQTKAVRALCAGVPHVLALSGTPLLNRPRDLFPTLNILRPDVFPAFFPYAQRYCAMHIDARGQWDTSGASNLDELHQLLLETCLVRIKKCDVLPGLAAKERLIIPLDLSDPAQYRKAATSFADWLAIHGISRLNRELRARKLAQLGELKHLSATLKLPALYAWLDAFLREGDEKMVIAGHHLDVIDALQDRYQECAVSVTGRVTGRARQAAFDRITGSRITRLLFGNLKAAGTAWSAANVPNVGFAELWWNSAVHEQFEDRAHGINRGVDGQATKVYYFIGRDTVEYRLLEMAQRKRADADAVLDGGGTAGGGGEYRVHDLLCQYLLEERQ